MGLEAQGMTRNTEGSQVGKVVRILGFSWRRERKRHWLQTSATSPAILSFEIQKAGRGGLLLSGGARASPAGFVPRLPRPFVWLPRCRAHGLLSNSGGSGGHVSGSRQPRGEGLRNHGNGGQWEARAARRGGTQRSRSRGQGGAEASKKLRAGPGLTRRPLALPCQGALARICTAQIW